MENRARSMININKQMEDTQRFANLESAWPTILSHGSSDVHSQRSCSSMSEALKTYSTPTQPPDPPDHKLNFISKTSRNMLFLLKYSYDEIDERMTNGFCIFCEERDIPGHQLKHKNLRIVMIECEDDDNDPEVGFNLEAMEKNLPVQEILSSCVNGINSAEAITNEESCPEKESLVEIYQEAESIHVVKPVVLIERSCLIQEEELQEANKSNVMTYCVPQLQVSISLLEPSHRFCNKSLDMFEDLPYEIVMNNQVLFQSGYSIESISVPRISLRDGNNGKQITGLATVDGFFMTENGLYDGLFSDFSLLNRMWEPGGVLIGQVHGNVLEEFHSDVKALQLMQTDYRKRPLDPGITRLFRKLLVYFGIDNMKFMMALFYGFAWKEFNALETYNKMVELTQGLQKPNIYVHVIKIRRLDLFASYANVDLDEWMLELGIYFCEFKNKILLLGYLDLEIQVFSCFKKRCVVSKMDTLILLCWMMTWITASSKRKLCKTWWFKYKAKKRTEVLVTTKHLRRISTCQVLSVEIDLTLAHEQLILIYDSYKKLCQKYLIWEPGGNLVELIQVDLLEEFDSNDKALKLKERFHKIKEAHSSKYEDFVYATAKKKLRNVEEWCMLHIKGKRDARALLFFSETTMKLRAICLHGSEDDLRTRLLQECLRQCICHHHEKEYGNKKVHFLVTAVKRAHVFLLLKDTSCSLGPQEYLEDTTNGAKMIKVNIKPFENHFIPVHCYEIFHSPRPPESFQSSHEGYLIRFTIDWINTSTQLFILEDKDILNRGVLIQEIIFAILVFSYFRFNLISYVIWFGLVYQQQYL